MRVQILVKALWIVQVSEERIEAIKRPCCGVVVPGAPGLLTAVVAGNTDFAKRNAGLLRRESGQSGT